MTGVPCAASCGRTTRRPAWPGGALCHSCARRRLHRHGRCSRCGRVRSLPGGALTEGATCRDCAGIDEDLLCRSCGADDDFDTLFRCCRCSLRVRLDIVFDDGTGAITPALVPLVAALAAMEVPSGGLSWLEDRRVVDRIGSLATGEVPLTHDGMDTLDFSNGREHLRELLIAHGILAARNRHLAAFERWSTTLLATIDDPADRRLIAAYLRWRHGPRLTRLAEAGTLTESRYAVARAQTNIAVRLLEWLHDRDADLISANQADIDVWFATGPTTRNHSRSFLRWAISTHRRAPLQLPTDRPGAPRAITEAARLDLLSRFLDDDDIAMVDRVAGCLVLLYALPVSRINRLRRTNFQPADGGLALRLGDDLVPVPTLLGVLIERLVEGRDHLTSAGHPDSDWLFPGRRAGQPIESEQLAERLNRHGVTRAARVAALDALLTTVPAPVLAKLLDRRPWRVADRSKILGTDWRRYVALRVQS
jgi:integrase